MFPEPATSEGVVTTARESRTTCHWERITPYPTAVVPVVTGNEVMEAVTVPVPTGAGWAVPFAGITWVVAAATGAIIAETGAIADSTRIRIIEKATVKELFWSI